MTLADVAARAGVSVATASVAITGRPSGNCRVSPAVAEKIRRAARALRYRPNLQARNLSTQRTNTVALIVKRSTWQNAMFYLTASQRVLRQRGYSEFFIIHPYDGAEYEREQLELCIGRRVEGIVIMPTIDLAGQTNVELINQIHEEEEIPVVQLALALEGCKVPSVAPDDVLCMKQAVHRLHEMGHRRIAHVTIRGHESADPNNPHRPAYHRFAGYTQAMRELGLEPRIFSPDHEHRNPIDMNEIGAELSAQIADAADRPTAVIAFSDFTAAGLMAGLTDRGLNVPRDISIIGYDDQLFGRMLRPQLSTLAPEYDRMGEFATQTLLSMIEGNPGESLALPPKLVLRQSVRDLQG